MRSIQISPQMLSHRSISRSVIGTSAQLSYSQGVSVQLVLQTEDNQIGMIWRCRACKERCPNVKNLQPLQFAPCRSVPYVGSTTFAHLTTWCRCCWHQAQLWSSDRIDGAFEVEYASDVFMTSTSVIFFPTLVPFSKSVQQFLRGNGGWATSK